MAGALKPTTLFSFGYWGWGNAVPQLVASIDAVEAHRGYAPPLLVDVRLSRNVRATGFNGSALEAVVGEDRYRWIGGLGNLGIRDGRGMRLEDPDAANELLDIAFASARDNRRVLFFCACPRPCDCHRYEVGRLLMHASAERNRAVEVVEWPGGDPLEDVKVELSERAFDKVRRGGKSVPLDDDVDLARAAAVPWYSLLAVMPEGEAPPSWRLMTGPAVYRKHGWHLPVYDALDQEPPAMLASVKSLREAHGFEPRQSWEALIKLRGAR